ncbi:hypothetical protein J6590_037779 [Homalodisca vitripennis]|nr:hypothetical protein J6590_037779 [Homalodisca vitripennis]
MTDGVPILVLLQDALRAPWCPRRYPHMKDGFSVVSYIVVLLQDALRAPWCPRRCPHMTDGDALRAPWCPRRYPHMTDGVPVTKLTSISTIGDEGILPETRRYRRRCQIRESVREPTISDKIAVCKTDSPDCMYYPGILEEEGHTFFRFPRWKRPRLEATCSLDTFSVDTVYGKMMEGANN